MSTVIVLNKNYQYWTEVPVKKVLKWIVLDKIEVVAHHESDEVGSLEFRIKMPLIVRLLNFIGYKPKREAIPYSDEAVFNRDDNYCQYWHFDERGRKYKLKLSEENRTIDHIVPVSRNGARNSFENCVTCCDWHNIKVKKNKTPSEAGLELVRKPVAPKRNRNEFVIMRFSYNRNKPSHNIYYEKFLRIA